MATLSFSKFLCVSSQFCDANHHLLFRILETSRDANIRSNIAIALGDVAVSFSTIVDENSDELYRGLSDRDLVVKKNTLMVLTHLILNGMIKVKGQLGEMAKCLEDEEPRLADLAKLFFTDLSTKDNAIYNNLPDGAFFFSPPNTSNARLCLDYAQSSATSQLANTRWTRKGSSARCATSSHSSRRLATIPSIRLKPLTHAYVKITGETSREHRRKALPALPPHGGHAAVARHRVLPIAPPVQVGALGEEAHRGPAVLPRQAARGRRVCSLPGNTRQGTSQ